MTAREILSPNELRKMLRYDADTGVLIWLKAPVTMFDGVDNRKKAYRWNSRYAEKMAFTVIHSAGYRQAGIMGRLYLAHRVAWAMFYGEWPKGEIDHINGDRSDNRIWNLRQTTRTQNMRNQKKHKSNTSGFTGVVWNKKTGRWRATITVSGRRIYLGSYEDISEAAAARAQANRKYGFHEKHGSDKIGAG